MTITDVFDRTACRKNGISARKNLSAKAHKDFDNAICQRIMTLPFFQTAKIVLLYAAFGGEPNLSAAAQAAHAAGKIVAYPICDGTSRMEAVVPLTAESWHIGKYGIRTPIFERSRLLYPEELDLVLVPCTAFDEQCSRIGMGKGYYDRYLERAAHAIHIGIAYEVQRVSHIQPGDWESPLDGFITETAHYEGESQWNR